MARWEAERTELKRESRAAAERLSEAQSSLDGERRELSRQSGQVSHLEERLAEERSRRLQAERLQAATQEELAREEERRLTAQREAERRKAEQEENVPAIR